MNILINEGGGREMESDIIYPVLTVLVVSLGCNFVPVGTWKPSAATLSSSLSSSKSYQGENKKKKTINFTFSHFVLTKANLNQWF